MSSYPFIKCLNPKRIVNPYTGEFMVVPCMRCPSCLMRKSAMNAMKCELESLMHKYTMFITLTYANAALPKMVLVARNRYLDDCGEVCDNYEQFRLEDITPRLGEVGALLGHTSNYLKVCRLAMKVELPEKILPYLNKRDAQLFIKRLRRNIERYYIHLNKIRLSHGQEPIETPKVRYYLVGEYGPKHFRPHFHLLLWFSDDTLYKVIREILHSSWKFGRIDCQKSKGNCVNYVAKYINCNCTLPEVFMFQRTRPFAIHSTHLGEKVLEVEREEVFKMEYREFVTRCVPSYDPDTKFFLWRSFKAFYFPKCKGFASKSKYQCLYAYSTYETASRWLGKDSVVNLAREILRCCYCTLSHVPIYPNIDYLPFDKELIDYFIESAGIMPLDYDNSELYLRAIYMELRLSKHFIQFVCQNDSSLYDGMLDRIIQFYSDEARFNLSNQYRDMVEFSESDFFDTPDDYEFIYYNRGFFVNQFKDSLPFRRYKQTQMIYYYDSGKHKKQNDANRIFL